ncbi:MAG: family 16 glycosylhydrolase [Cyclonatronaceae bacterium]
MFLVTGTSNAQTWELVWSDEFDGTGLDESKWSYQYGTGASVGLSGWGNAELQYYTDREQNVYVQDGKLHIVAREETHGGMDYTSARLRSIDQGDWRYGRFEVRAKLPKGQGIWPAIWMMPTDAVYGSWPASGEIDIMELVGHQPDVIHGTIHYGPPHTYSGGSHTRSAGDFSDDFHTFAIEWEHGEIRWYVDDMHYHTETNWFSEGHSFPAPFEQRFHFLLNVAVGGNWPGSPDQTTEFPQQMVIDYVRVYQDTDAQHGVSLPLLFEDRYFDFDDVFTGFDGGSVTVVDNPDPDDVNSTDRVGRMVKDGGAFDGGVSFEAERPFSFSDDHNEVTMKVWSPREDVPILVKLEQLEGDAEYEIVRQTTTSGQWEILAWNVSSGAYPEEWDIITLIFDFEEGQIGDGSDNFTWFFDELDVFGADLDVPDTPDGMLPVSLPLTFEDYSFDWERAFTGFSGGEITVVENPQPDEVNDSDWVGSMVKDGGAFWGGAFMHVNRIFVFDEDNHTITMKVWSPREDVQVLLKVEQQNGVLDYEKAEPTTTSGEWEEMTWDMSGAGFENQWDLITLIFDFEQDQIGDGSEDFTWYFDDLHVFAGEVSTSSNYAGTEVPATLELHQNYPNPFNPATILMFDLPQQADVRLEVFNVMGQRVATLASGMHQAGRHSVEFDASHLSSGVYMYRLQAGPVSLTRKMTLIQ